MSAIPNNEAWHIFFEVYRGLPELWNMKSDIYKNKCNKKIAFSKLLDIYKMIDNSANADSLKRRLHNIKCCYRRELKKVLASQESAEIDKYVPALWYFDLLDFLRDQETPSVGDDQETQAYEFRLVEVVEDGTTETHVTTSEYPPACPPQTYEESRQRLRSYLDQLIERNSQIVGCANKKFKSSDGQPTLPTQHHTVFKKILPKEDLAGPVKDQEWTVKDMEWPVKDMEWPVKDMEWPVKDTERPLKDDAFTYAKSWAVSFRKLSKTQKIYAKKAIEDILVLGQLDCLSLNTVDIITSSGNAPYP